MAENIVLDGCEVPRQVFASMMQVRNWLGQISKKENCEIKFTAQPSGLLKLEKPPSEATAKQTNPKPKRQKRTDAKRP